MYSVWWISACVLLEPATSILRRVTALKMEAAGSCETLIAACLADDTHHITETVTP
jgi:hypothetical protein